MADCQTIQRVARSKRSARTVSPERKCLKPEIAIYRLHFVLCKYVCYKFIVSC